MAFMGCNDDDGGGRSRSDQYGNGIQYTLKYFLMILYYGHITEP